MELRLRLNDHTAAAVTQHNLRLLEPPPVPPTPPPTQAVPHGQHRGRLLAAISAAVLAMLALGVGAAVATGPSDSPGDGWPPAIETSSPSAPRLTTINVTPHDSTLAPGGTRQLTAVGTYSDGSTGSITGPVRWRSNATGVATVDAAGLTAAKNIGTATITASTGNLHGSATITVSRTAPTLTAITVTPTNVSICNTSVKLKATGTYSDRPPDDITTSVSWESDAPDVATVDADGRVTGNDSGIGIATITASSGNVHGSAKVHCGTVE